MNEKDRTLISSLTDIIDDLSNGKYSPVGNLDNLETSDDISLHELREKVVSLNNMFSETYPFIIALSRGNLNIEAPVRNPFANVYKQLHSELRHLTWQIQQISEGNYDQKVSFSGDFSDAINKMIVALREREELMERNKENQELFHSFFRASPDGVIVCNLEGKILTISDSVKRTLPITNQDLSRGIFFNDFFDEEHKSKNLNFFNRLKAGGESGFIKVSVKNLNGDTIWLEQNASLIRDCRGNVKGFVIIFRDITKRTIAEDKLNDYTQRLKSSNETKDKLFSIISHDLKNPFGVIVNFSDILLNEVQSGNFGEVEDYARILNSTAVKTQDLLNNLLEWSKVQSGRIEIKYSDLDLTHLILFNIEIANLTASQKEIQIYFDDSKSRPIRTDGSIFNTVLRNLLGNAVKYTPQNGSIEVLVDKKEDHYVISVKDSGVGISEESIEKLFRMDVIHTTPGTKNEGGTGLGLILCKDFITELGGEIWVESKLGKGSSFTFTLPDRNVEGEV